MLESLQRKIFPSIAKNEAFLNLKPLVIAGLEPELQARVDVYNGALEAVAKARLPCIFGNGEVKLNQEGAKVASVWVRVDNQQAPEGPGAVAKALIIDPDSRSGDEGRAILHANGDLELQGRFTGAKGFPRETTRYTRLPDGGLRQENQSLAGNGEVGSSERRVLEVKGDGSCEVYSGLTTPSRDTTYHASYILADGHLVDRQRMEFAAQPWPELEGSPGLNIVASYNAELEKVQNAPLGSDRQGKTQESVSLDAAGNKVWAWNLSDTFQSADKILTLKPGGDLAVRVSCDIGDGSPPPSSIIYLRTDHTLTAVSSRGETVVGRDGSILSG